MTRRLGLVDYAGAKGRTSISAVLRLGPRWVVQEKRDGAYAHVHLDSRGRIERILSRSAQEFRRDLVGDLLGCLVGAPHAVLVGELEAHTEAGTRAAAAAGFRSVHLFDIVRAGDLYLGREPYRARQDWLLRSQEWAERNGPGLPYTVDALGHAHDRQSGRWCTPIPLDHRRTPLVASRAPAHAGELWERALVGDLEGLVAVNLDAPLGRRGAKVKCKPTSTIDATVISSDGHAASLLYAGVRFVVSARAKGLVLRPGQVVEVAHDGWYEAGGRIAGKSYGELGQPRFARIVRRRPDLEGTTTP